MAIVKKAVSVETLAKWLTTELRKFEGCEECTIPGVYRLQSLDAHGCNWSVDGIHVHATGVPRSILDPAVANVVDRARRHFNVA